jgi:hypothetical protein
VDLTQKMMRVSRLFADNRDVDAKTLLVDILKTHADELSAEMLMQIQELAGLGQEIWEPFPGPQVQALDCKADELFYGGAAGGGKSDLLIGLSLTAHKHSIIYRREGTQLVGILQRMGQIIGDRKGLNGQDKIWKHGNRLIEFGAVKDLGSEEKYQGRPHDLKGFDEITHFIQEQYTFLNGWKRSADPKQRVRTVATGNPPTRPEGIWVKKYWGPWLDRNNPLYNKIEPAELAYYYRDHEGNMQFLREYDEVKDKDGEIIKPRSLTFIPSKVEDNPVYMETGYKQQLQSLPEPLRSQMLKGDFEAFSDDDPFQVIPTNWIAAAQERWTKKTTAMEKGPMDALGVDPARGGMDNTVICKRYGYWYDELKLYPGGSTPNGQTVVSLIVAERKDAAPIIVDVIGVGASVVDIADMQGLDVRGWNNSEGAPGMIDRLRFVNKRSWVYWNMRTLLDPEKETGIALPPDDDLLAELAAHKFSMTPRGIQVWPKDKVKEAIGRSPDKADAVVMASVETPKRGQSRAGHNSLLAARDAMAKAAFTEELGKIAGRKVTAAELAEHFGDDGDVTIPDDYNPYY